MSLTDPRLEWVERYADGLASEKETRDLEKALREDPVLRRTFQYYMNVDSALEALSAAGDAETAAKLVRFPKPPVWRWAAAAAFVAFVTLCLSWLRSNGQAVTVSILEAKGAPGWRTGETTKVRKVLLPQGEVVLQLPSGAVLSVRGPADLEFVDAMRLRVSKGQVTTDVGDKAKGFTVETAQTQVVDLGTKFGVDVTESGHTDVVVFQGEVELYKRQRRSPDAPISRLTEGEAVRVDARQQLSRIVNVTSGPGSEQWSSGEPKQAQSVIAAVRDNLRDPQDKYFYRIVPGGLREDVPAFIGQRHEWNGLDATGIAPWLLGADLVQTFVSDRLRTSLEITVTVSKPAVVFVFFDDRNERPEWLTERFTDTGTKIGLENAPTLSSGKAVAKGPGAGHMAPLSVWKYELPQAGSVTLGPPRRFPDEKPAWNWMYGIAAKPLSSQ